MPPCKDWVQRVKALPEGFTAFKINIDQAFRVDEAVSCRPCSPRRCAGFYRAYANVKEAAGDDLDIAVACHGEFDAPSSIAIAKAIEPLNLLFLEDAAERSVLGSMGGVEARLARSDHDRRKARTRARIQAIPRHAVGRYHPPGRVVCRRHHRSEEDRRLRGVHPHAGGAAQRRLDDSNVCVGPPVDGDPELLPVGKPLGRPEGIYEGMVADGRPAVKNGILHMPNAPGLGLKINEDHIKKHLLKTEPYWG